MRLITKIVKVITLVAAATLIFPIQISYNLQYEQVDGKIFRDFWEFLNNTSSGLASGAVTTDGRPLLWKSRDRSNRFDMELHYRADLGYAFTAITDINDSVYRRLR